MVDYDMPYESIQSIILKILNFYMDYNVIRLIL